MPPGQTLAGLFAERTPLYRQYADLTIDGTSWGIEETVRAIAKFVMDIRPGNTGWTDIGMRR